MFTIRKLFNYLSGVKSEIRKVRWSKGKEVVQDFTVVAVIVFILIAFFSVSDLLIINIKDWMFK